MRYELHPLSSLFPRMVGAEFLAMTRFSGVRADGLCLVNFWISTGSQDFWHYKIFDVESRLQSHSVRPIAGSGVWLILEEMGGVDKWTITPQDKKEDDGACSGYIYFIRSGETGPVKIGWVKSSVESRLLALQCGNPEELIICKVLENKSIADEYELHRRFSKFRIRGEWFSAEVLDSKDV